MPYQHLPVHLGLLAPKKPDTQAVGKMPFRKAGLEFGMVLDGNTQLEKDTQLQPVPPVLPVGGKRPCPDWSPGDQSGPR